VAANRFVRRLLRRTVATRSPRWLSFPELVMSGPSVHQCECVQCRQALPHPDQARHAQMNLFLSRLDEQQRRWYVALEADRLGHGGERLLAPITGMDEKTIRRGREELAAGLADRPTERVRLPGGGRPPVEKKTPR
jgi:hypothetical protein